MDEFDMPVCIGFKAKILNDQLCYEVDPNTFYKLKSNEYAMKKGLSFLVDFNEDRQVLYEKENVKKGDNLYGKFSQTKECEKLMVLYLNTIGKYERKYNVEIMNDSLKNVCQNHCSSKERENTI